MAVGSIGAVYFLFIAVSPVIVAGAVSAADVADAAVAPSIVTGHRLTSHQW